MSVVLCCYLDLRSVKVKRFTEFCSVCSQLGALVPEEPRLGKKLIDPLTHIINTTPAKSLLYECIITVIAGTG